jgi:hypothetical protein
MQLAWTHVVVSDPVAKGGQGEEVEYRVMVGQLTLSAATVAALMVKRAELASQSGWRSRWRAKSAYREAKIAEKGDFIVTKWLRLSVFCFKWIWYLLIWCAVGKRSILKLI